MSTSFRRHRHQFRFLWELILAPPAPKPSWWLRIPPINKFIEWNHWKFGENILKAAEYVCHSTGLYPVVLTAFTCSPDSFVINYFKEIMDAYHKPYLLLQLDEHGSDVGYETRIEAAIRSFSNHYQQKVTTDHPRKYSHLFECHDPHCL